MTPRKDEFVRLWTSAQPEVSAYISAIIPDYHDAKDILQDCALVLLEKFSQYDSSRPFLSWALGVARIEIFSRRRRYHAEKLVFDEPALDSIEDAFDYFDTEVDERVEALRYCAGKARGRARELLDLRYGENLKPREIAKRIGSNPNATTVALARIREALRQCMEKRLGRQQTGGSGLVSLTSAFIDQRLTPDEAQSLRNAVVEESQSARCVTLELVFHRQLYDIFHGERALCLEEDSPELSADWRHSAVQLPAITETTEDDFEVAAPPLALPQAAPGSQRRGHFSHWKKMAAAVLLAITATATIILHRSATHPPVAVAPATAATLAQLVNAEWEDGSAKNTSALLAPGDRLALRSGYCRVDFNDGTHVIVEGPAHCTIDAGNTISLSDGELTAAMASGAKGFVVRTPTTTITDLGTEFGVAYDARKDVTEVDVFKGSVRVQAASHPAEPASLSGGDMAVVTNGSVTLTPAGSVPQRFVRELSTTSIGLDVADLVSGGDGTTKLRGGMIDPSTGMQTQKPTVEIPTDNLYHRVSSLPVIDGCFIPNGGAGPVQVDSLGHRFPLPKTDGSAFNMIVGGNHVPIDPAKSSVPIPTLMGSVDYSRSDHSLLYLHANVGITFDLAALRRLHPGLSLSSFGAMVGNSFAEPLPNDGPADIFFIVDGVSRLERPFHQSDAFPVDVPLADADRFLTIVTTDGADDHHGRDIMLGDPKFEMKSAAVK